MQFDPYKNYKFRALVGEETKWHGYWITSHRFYHLPACHHYGHDRKPEFNSDIQNIHTLFRKRFFVRSESIRTAKLYITGDDLYKLYINSDFVGEGPAQSYPFAYNYNCYDVKELLVSGENTVAVHLYYQGLFNIYLMSADNLCGMIAELEITYTDGTVERVVSDSSWLYKECTAYSSRYTYGYQTQFSEDIDMSLYPYSWTDKSNSDSDWCKAIITANPYPPEYNLIPQITPPVKHEKIYPEKIKITDDVCFMDFGKEITGTLAFSLEGMPSDRVEIRYGEELDENGRVRYQIRANCTYSDIITLSGKKDFVDYFDYKGFRYVEIINAKGNFDPNTVYTFNRHYPFPSRIASFRCSDETMNRIWSICVQGVKVGTQDTYYDCPTREKGGFVGDALISGLSHLIITGDTRIYKKFIVDCANASRYCPAIMAHLPTYDINICADYSSLIPLFLLEYYNYTGDIEFIREMLPVADGIWAYYSEFLNGDMLLEKIKHMDKVPSEMCPILIDWPVNLRDGYDMEKAVSGISTTINMFFYGFLKTTSQLYSIVGEQEQAEKFKSLYTGMGKSIINSAYGFDRGIFRDTPDSEHCSIHANALQLFFELDLPNGYAKIKELLMERRLNCGVYFAYFVIKGLYNIGECDAAFNLLTGKDEHSWYNMLKSGATTCMEAWGPDQKWNTSWCHPWSSSPIYFYTSEIMGIKANEPGMKSVRIAPKIPCGLDFAEIEIPTPNGFLNADFKKQNGKIIYTVSAPENVDIIFEGDGIVFNREK